LNTSCCWQYLQLGLRSCCSCYSGLLPSKKIGVLGVLQEHQEQNKTSQGYQIMSQLTFDLTAASILLDSSEQFPVDFDRAWQWLGYASKQKCLDKLKSSFVVMEDFNQTVVNSTQQGGRPSDKYYLTIECFKMLGMMAGTEQGKLVRKYFLECERVAKSGITTIELWQLALQQSQQIDRLQSELAENIKIVNSNAKVLTQVKDLANDTSCLVDRLLDRNVQLQSELDRLEHPYGKYYTVLGWLNLHKVGLNEIKQLAPSEVARIGKLCTAQCEKRRITIEQVHDMRYGTVGAYPETIIHNCIPQEFYI
jgi:phage anti-repressor protein